MKNGTVLTPKQLKELISAIAQGIPTDLPKEYAQYWIGAKGSLHDRISKVLQNPPNPYADEIVESDSGYPDGYSPKSLKKQIEVLHGFYPELDFSHVQKLGDSWGELPEKAEHLQLCPKLTSVGRQLGIVDPLNDGYGSCLEQILWYLDDPGNKFENCCKGTLTENNVRLLPSTRQTLERLESEQETPGDCLVVPINSGLLYRGSSIRRARWEIEYNNQQQWAAPSWLAVQHLLTHPDRISTASELQINCPGDEYTSDAKYPFQDRFCFDLTHSKLEFSYYYFGAPSPRFGSLVAFSQE